MDNKKIASELLEISKSVMKIAVSRELESAIGKASVHLVGINDILIRSEKDMDTKVKKNLIKQMNNVFDEMNKLDDMVDKIR